MITAPTRLGWFHAPGRIVWTLLVCGFASGGVAANDSHSGTVLQMPETGTTATPASRGIAIDDLLGLINIGEMIGEGLSISPDGRLLAFEAHQAALAENTYRVAWFVASVKSGHPVVNVGDGGDPTLFMNMQGAWQSQRPHWSPDSEWIAYRRKAGGTVQIWRSRHDRSRQEQLTHNAADVESFGWSRDGHRIYFSTDAPAEEIAAVELQEAAEGYLVDDSEFNGFYRVQPIRPPYRLTGGKPRRWIYEVESQLERIANDAEWAEYEDSVKSPTLETRPMARSVTFSHDNKRIAWLENRKPEVHQGFLAPLTVFASSAPDGSLAKACTASLCTGRIHGLWWNGESEVIFERVDNGLWGLYAWSIESGSVRPILETHDWMSDCSVTQRLAVCFREGPATPRRIVAVSLGNGTLTTLVEPNPDWEAIELGQVERLEWESEAHRSSWGYLVKPIDYEEGKRYPLLIIQYDARMCLRGGTGDEFPTHLFSAKGIAVLCVSGSGEDPEIYKKIADPYAIFRAEYDNFSRHRRALASLEAVIGILARRGLVDPGRVGITGLSAGVETLQYALIHSRLFAVAATAGGGMEPMSYYGSTKHSRSQILDPIGFGDFMQGQGEKWRAFSLSLNVDKIDVPLLIQAADREYLHALQTAVTWKVAGKPIEMHVFPDEHHVKWQPLHRFHTYVRNVDWFRFWLKNEEDPDPAKADQYRRWRALLSQQDVDPNQATPADPGGTD